MQLHGGADLSAFDKTCKSCGGVNAIGKEAGELPGQFGDIYLETWTNIVSNSEKYIGKFGQIHFA